MKILDCESINSIYTSLEQILEIDRGAIESIFRNVDFTDFHKDNPYRASVPEDHLFCAVKSALPSTKVYFSQICWFHLTRTVETNNFEQGILPLGQQIGPIWTFLYSLLNGGVSKKEWNKFKRDISKSNNDFALHYRVRINGPENYKSFHWGPYALLIREFAFRAEEMCNYDYLRRGPEIVEIICNFFSHCYTFNLYEAYLEKTKPCIVKFVDNSSEPKYIRAALNYLYSCHTGSRLNDYCNDCFNAGGKPIPKDRILNVEFPKV